MCTYAEMWVGYSKGFTCLSPNSLILKMKRLEGYVVILAVVILAVVGHG